MNFRTVFLSIFAAAALFARPAAAQEDYRFEAGAGIGMTGYLGDANTASLWRNPGFDAEILFRYIISPRFALKTNAYVATLRGNTAQMEDILPGGAQYKFGTTMWELGELFEFNFFNFGQGETYRKLRRWTPYITAGLGLNYWSIDRVAHASFCLPLGAGIKWKVAERLNLGFEFLMKKVFSDKVDGSALDDPYGIKSSFAKNTDWYSTMSITVSYEFGKRCATCHYKD